MVAAAAVVPDESAGAGLEVAWQIVVLQQDAVLQGLMPTLDLALGLRMVRCAADVKAKRAKLEGRGIAGKTAIVGAKDRATKTDFPFGSAAFSCSESCSGPRERPAVRSVVLSFLSISGQLDPV